jgi:hypothetical protein
MGFNIAHLLNSRMTCKGFTGGIGLGGCGLADQVKASEEVRLMTGGAVCESRAPPFIDEA